MCCGGEQQHLVLRWGWTLSSRGGIAIYTWGVARASKLGTYGAGIVVLAQRVFHFRTGSGSHAKGMGGGDGHLIISFSPEKICVCFGLVVGACLRVEDDI